MGTYPAATVEVTWAPDCDVGYVVDLETLGVARDSVVLSIGIVKFSLIQNKVLDLYSAVLDISEQLLEGRTVEKATQNWWCSSGVSQEARDAARQNPKSVPIVLGEIKSFVKGNPKTIFMVGNSPTFDQEILRSLFFDFDMEYPWPYWRELDCRSYVSLFKDLVPAPEFVGIKHTAADDALNEAQHLLLILNQLRRSLLLSQSLGVANV